MRGAPAGVSVWGAPLGAGVAAFAAGVAGVAEGVAVVGVAPLGFGVGDALGVGRALAGALVVVVGRTLVAGVDVVAFDAPAVLLPRRSEAGIGKLGGLTAVRVVAAAAPVAASASRGSATAGAVIMSAAVSITALRAPDMRSTLAIIALAMLDACNLI